MQEDTIDGAVSKGGVDTCVADSPRNPLWTVLPRYGMAIGGGVILLACVWAWIDRSFGSMAGFAAAAQGQRLYITPAQIDLGRVPAGKEKAAVVRAHNLTGHAIRIVGAQPSCSCVSVLNLPISLAPHAAADISLVVKVHESETRQTVEFFADDGSLTARQITLREIGVAE